jgi:zinc transport system substrate-binding protein
VKVQRRSVRRWLPALLSLAAMPWLVGCGASEGGGEAPVGPGEVVGPLSVVAVSYPLGYFAERIGGGRVRVRFPVPAGVDPADWSPDAETVAAFQAADLILRNGAGYAGWVDRASLPRARLVDTSAAIRDRLIPLEGGLSHVHGPAGAHSHQGFASTTWLDPQLAVAQARAVADAFAKARPGQEAAFQAGLAALEADLEALDRHLAAAASALGDVPLLFSHPVYPYLERRYGLEARSLHWEPDQPPSQAAWRELDALLAEHPVRWLLWEAEPSEATRRRLEERGVRSGVFSPCGNAPEQGDYLDAMRSNAAALEAASD